MTDSASPSVSNEASPGQTINHIAAVIIPVVGGVVWKTVGSDYTFLVGVGIVGVSLILVQWMDAGRSPEWTGAVQEP